MARSTHTFAATLVVALSALGSAAALEGCTVLEDFDQYTSGGAGGASGSGGAAGKAGAAGLAGAAGSGGSGGNQGGSAGSAGTSGSAGTGGVAGASGASGSAGAAGGEAGVATEGTACPKAGALACAGHAQKSTLVCDAASMLWKLAAVCTGAQLCDTSPGVNLGSCQDPAPACVGKKPGDISCQMADRVKCGVDLVTTTKLATCGSADLCAQSTGETCVACLKGEKRCTAEKLEQCDDKQDAFVALQTCATAELCDAKMGACTPPACDAGAFSCDGDALMKCNAGRTALDKVMDCMAGLCDAKGGQCFACKPSQLSCSDPKTVATCSADGKTQTTSPCPADKPSCVMGACVACQTDSDCPGSADGCNTGKCGAGQCSFVPVKDGTDSSKQTAGDCKKQVCMGGKPQAVADTTDVPADDGDPCTLDTCNGTMPTHPPAAFGAKCPAGACVQGKCVSGASCGQADYICGPGENETCCASGAVDPGTFDRGYDASSSTTGIVGYQAQGAAPATITTFSMDLYEVTVARFRKFVEAYPASAPKTGDGAVAKLNYAGWNSDWTPKLPVTADDYKKALVCITDYPTWTDTADMNESLPITCVNWYDAMAFCAWDGGRLPTEAEWNYAAAGGAEQRPYPWASPPTSLTIDGTYASYYVDNTSYCSGDGIAGCAFTDIVTPGKFAKGKGKWGQYDLSGNVREWVMDSFINASTYPSATCTDCLFIDESSVQSLTRGGGYTSKANEVRSAYRFGQARNVRSGQTGFRCVR